MATTRNALLFPLILVFGLPLFLVGLGCTLYWLAKSGAPAGPGAATRMILPLLLLGLITSVNLGLRWFRWHFLMRKLDILLPAKQSAKVYLITLPAIATPFYLGELLRPAILAGRYERAWRRGSAAWVYERAADALVIAMLLLLATRSAWLWAAALAGVALVVAAAGWAVRRTALRALFHPRVLAVVVATSFAAWALVAFGFWATLHFSGVGVSGAAATECFASSTLIGGVTGLPLGIGVTGSSAILMLEHFGADPSGAVVSIAVFRAGTTWYALAAGVAALLLWGRKLAADLRAGNSVAHFDEIAEQYEEEIPEHVRARLVARKTAATRRLLDSAGVPAGARGLDIGCGQGWYASELARAGYAMSACDMSDGQIARARVFAAKQGAAVEFTVADATALPYPDASFDFACAVNVLHHIPAAARGRALGEIARMLKPGGAFVLHEINVENPFFRFYMGYVFPILRVIDEGNELWVRPSRLPEVPGCRWDREIAYLTFLPDFIPGPLVHPLSGVEGALERSRLRSWSAHYAACLRKGAAS